jgi:hypothetical protein
MPSGYDLVSPLSSDLLIVNKTDKVACQQTVLPSLYDPSLRRFILGCSGEIKLNVVKLEGIGFVVSVASNYFFGHQVHLYGIVGQCPEPHQSSIPLHPPMLALITRELQRSHVYGSKRLDLWVQLEVQKHLSHVPIFL